MPKVTKTKARVKVKYRGQFLLLNDLKKFATGANISTADLYHRIIVSKWNIKKALSTPVIKKDMNNKHKKATANATIQNNSVTDEMKGKLLQFNAHEAHIISKALIEHNISLADAIKKGLGIQCSYVGYFDGKEFNIQHVCTKTEAENIIQQKGGNIYLSQQEANKAKEEFYKLINFKSQA